MTSRVEILQETSRVDPAAVQRELDAILGRSEFHPEEGRLDGIADFLSSIFDTVVSPEQAIEIAWAVALVLALLVSVFLVARALKLRRLPRVAVAGAATPAERRRDVEALRRAAAEARAAGDLRGALRLTWFALVVGLGQRGSLAYHAAWTNRELLERGDPEPTVRALLEPVLVEIEAKEFGHEPTTERDVEQLDELCQRTLGVTA